MTFTTSFIKKFAWISIISGVLYFFGESYFIYLYGQPFTQTIADGIAIFLLFFGSYIALKNQKSLGIICGAWGFNFCINYRAWAWRQTSKEMGTSNNDIDTVGSILLTLLIFSFTAFIISILLNLSKPKSEK